MKYHLYNSSKTPTIVDNSFHLKEGTHFYYENEKYCIDEIIKSSDEEETAYCTQTQENSIVETRRIVKESFVDYKFRLFSLFKSFGIILNENDITEQKLTDAFCTLFKNDFEIKKNVWGVHYSGKKVCLDLMLIPKDTSLLRNKKITIGIEIKNPFTYGDKGRRSSDLFAQCLDYAQSKFENYENVIILICPILHGFENETRLSRFLSRFNVGHVKFYEDSYYLKLGLEPFWSNKNGFIGLSRKSMMKLKTGNRRAKNK